MAAPEVAVKPCVLNRGDIFELIDDDFDKSSFAQQELVCQVKGFSYSPSLRSYRMPNKALVFNNNPM